MEKALFECTSHICGETKSIYFRAETKKILRRNSIFFNFCNRIKSGEGGMVYQTKKIAKRILLRPFGIQPVHNLLKVFLKQRERKHEALNIELK